MKKLSVHKWISICFPIYLIAFEMLVRQISKVDISSFLGPTLAASGLGFLIESIKPRKVVIPEEIKEKLIGLPDEFTFRYKGDEKLIHVSYATLLICIMVWFYTCTLSLKPINEDNASFYGFSLGSLAFILGCFNYLVGIVFSTLKGE